MHAIFDKNNFKIDLTLIKKKWLKNRCLQNESLTGRMVCRLKYVKFTFNTIVSKTIYCIYIVVNLFGIINSLHEI